MNYRWLYTDSAQTHVAFLTEPKLATLMERHRMKLSVPPLSVSEDPLADMLKSGAQGMVIGMCRGWPGLPNLRLARRVLGHGRKVCFYWPEEQAIECVDDDRLGSQWLLFVMISLYEYLAPHFFRRFLFRVVARKTRQRAAASCVRTYREELNRIAVHSGPIPLPDLNVADLSQLFERDGVYIRTDFAPPEQSGVIWLSRNAGIQPVVLAYPAPFDDEERFLRACSNHYRHLRAGLEPLRPAYIYEQFCLGNWCGARLSQELQIPYLLDYNGSEVEARCNGGEKDLRDVYLTLEKTAFQKAVLITVPSERIKDELVRRDVDSSKVLVNPNGVYFEHYSEISSEDRASVRRKLAWSESHRVIGCVMSHNSSDEVELLAATISKVCRRIPEARFLLIGVWQSNNSFQEKILWHELEGRVKRVATPIPVERAQLLAACDMCVSVHAADQAHSLATVANKVFEFMAAGRVIVASDVERLRYLLHPALRLDDLGEPGAGGSGECAVLVTPENVEELVEAVHVLIKNPYRCSRLGANARQALMNHLRGLRAHSPCSVIGSTTTLRFPPNNPVRKIETLDLYKEGIQNHWNDNPCGAQYAPAAEWHTLEWFKAVEAHRFKEYAPWMPETMEFRDHCGEHVLEIGGGLGTDLCQFALNGAQVTDVDLSAAHLDLAEENFKLRGLTGQFFHHDAEKLPFQDNAFDLVYSNGVIHHTPNTAQVVREIWRVLKPGGKAIVMVYAQNSWNHWVQVVFRHGLLNGMLRHYSLGEIMSRKIEFTETGSHLLVKVYTMRALRRMFREFVNIEIAQRQLTRPELPFFLQWIPLDAAAKWIGWNLIIKAYKPN